MHGRLRGVSQTQMMGRHKANHIQVAYGHDEPGAKKAALAKAALAEKLGIAVNWCGTHPRLTQQTQHADRSTASAGRRVWPGAFALNATCRPR